MKTFLLMVPLILSSVLLLALHVFPIHATEYSAPSTYYPMDITHEVAVRPGGKELYVASIHSSLVLVVDIDSLDYPILGAIQLPGGEVALTPQVVFSHDGAYAYMSRHHSEDYIESWGLQDANYIVVINCERREIDRIIPMRSYCLAESLAPSPNGRWLYFTTRPAPDNPSVGVGKLDLTSQEVVRFLSLGLAPTTPTIALSSTGKHIYATLGDHPPGIGDNLFYIVDAESLEVVCSVEVGDGPRFVAVTPNDEKAFVSNRWSNDVTVIDLDSAKVVATVTVGPEPREIAITPDGMKAYVALTGVTPILAGLPGYLYGNKVGVVDVEHNLLLGAVEVHIDPESVSMDPDGTRAYVGDGGANGPNDSSEVHVIDTVNDAYIRPIILRQPPQIAPAGIDITPDGRKLFITSFPRGSLLAIDAVTGKILDELNIEPRAVKISAYGSKVYAFSPASPESEGRLHVIDSNSLNIIASIALGKTGSATVSPMPSYRIVLNNAETLAYINYETLQKAEKSIPDWIDPNDTGLVSVDLLAGKVEARIFYSENPDIPFKGMALTPDGSKLFVSDPPSRTVAVIDTSTNNVTARVPMANNPSEIKISQDGKRAYVLQQLCQTLLMIIDVETHQTLSSIQMPYGIHGQTDFEISLDERYVYVSCLDSNFVMVYDLQAGRVVKVIDTGLDPFNCASTPDIRCIYVGEVTDDKISVVNTTTTSIERTIKLVAPITYVVRAEGKEFRVIFLCNFTTWGFTFNQTMKEISVLVSGPAGTVGFSNVTIPRALLDGPYTLKVDGTTTEPTVVETDTDCHLYFTYSHGTKIIKIEGTTVIPEFPSIILPVLMMAITLIASFLKPACVLRKWPKMALISDNAHES